MRFRRLSYFSIVALMVQQLSGCGAILQTAIVGAGKTATADDTGFLKSYQGLAPSQDPAYPAMPDLSYISPQVRMGAYHKIIMLDFTSISPNIDKLTGLQIRQYKSIKQDLPDLIAGTFDGSTFNKVARVSERYDPKDIAAIRKLPADAVLMGNIKELVSLGGENRAGLTAIQIEYKLIDLRTGEEVVTAIHRSTTDLDKVAMGQVRVLSGLLNKAKAMKVSSAPDQIAPPVATSSIAKAAPVAVSATVTYANLVAYSLDDANQKTPVGKSVQIGVTGKTELGYFAKKSDAVTFVCSSGDKILTGNKPAKGIVQGTLTKATGWEGSTVWTLKDCQFVTATPRAPLS